MEFTETLVRQYAKRIFGFAYAKTNNFHNAEDLAQEIILALCDGSLEDKQIGNMDGYIYRICCYCWSKYLRRNKPGWQALNSAEALEYMESGDNIEEGLIQQELSHKLRQGISPMGRIPRHSHFLQAPGISHGDIKDLKREDYKGFDVVDRITFSPSGA